jgi:hypothetical protein
MGDQAVALATVVTTGNPPKNQAPMQLMLVNADGSTAGTVKKAAAQADSVASTVAALVTDFNALLAKLRTAGVIG